MPAKRIAELISHLKTDGHVYIQTHDFPDHDSVTSAFGLQYLLRTQGVSASITYEGELQRESLLAMTEALGVVLHHNGYYDIRPRDRVVIVDGCTGNRNVSHLVGREVGVIDHHMTEHPEDVPFVDIRPAYGACASIVYDYFHKLNLHIPRDIATALLIGISVDTAQLMRGAADADVQAYTQLYRRADTGLVKSVLGNSIQQRDLAYYRSALDNVLIHDQFAFCYLPRGCSRNLLGILSDFFAGLREVDVVVLCAPDGHRTNFSVRCAHDRWNASLLIQEALKGIGFGGGHRHMAGGSIHEPCGLDI
ncbi:MAG: recombinase RecJ, partial [Chitinivibrionales bacterium]|nr:recombinase RecJ [Chitinivibrionales bacterium]